MDALTLGVDAQFEARARRYLGELQRWSHAGRLTGYRTEAAQVRHLVLESLLLLAAVPPPASPLLDLGTGAGVPGLLLKLARPEWDIALLEAGRRRVNFLRHVVRTLGLVDVRIHHGRAEVLAREPGLTGTFRTVTSRAVAAPREAARLARPFLRPDGRLVLALGVRRPAGPGRVCEVALPASVTGLPSRRAFLIIEAADIETRVPRGT